MRPNAATPPLPVVPPEQMEDIQIDTELAAAIDDVVSHYPTAQAALGPVLWLCQNRWGWISSGVITTVAERLGLSPAFVQGMVTFYTMYQTTPPGRYLVQVCTTLSCQLCRTTADEIVEHLGKRLGVGLGETTEDGLFTLVDVQCLGACGEGPVVQINNDYYTELTVDGLDELLDELISAADAEPSTDQEDG
jgi:NADH-quinone oxidoreductase E subunit